MSHYIQIETHLDEIEMIEQIFNINISKIKDYHLKEYPKYFELTYWDSIKRNITINKHNFKKYLKRMLDTKTILFYKFHDQAFDSMTIKYLLNINELDDLKRLTDRG